MASFKITSFPCSNDAAQSDDEEKLQSHPTDTDGGRLKQKTWVTVHPFSSFQAFIFKKMWELLYYFKSVLHPIYKSIHHHDFLPSAHGLWGLWGCVGHIAFDIYSKWSINFATCLYFVLTVGIRSISRRTWWSLKLPFLFPFICRNALCLSKPNYMRFFLTSFSFHSTFLPFLNFSDTYILYNLN